MTDKVQFHSAIPIRLSRILPRDIPRGEELSQRILEGIPTGHVSEYGWRVRSPAGIKSNYFADKASIGRKLDPKLLELSYPDVKLLDFTVNGIELFFSDFGYAIVELQFTEDACVDAVESVRRLPQFQEVSERIFHALKDGSGIEDRSNSLLSEISGTITRYHSEVKMHGIELMERSEMKYSAEIAPDYMDYVMIRGCTADEFASLVPTFLSSIGERFQESEIGRSTRAGWIAGISASCFYCSDDESYDMLTEISSKAIIAWCIIQQIEMDAKATVWDSLRRKEWSVSDFEQTVRLQKVGRLALLDLSPSRAATWSSTNTIFGDLWHCWSLDEGSLNAKAALDFAIQLQGEEAERARRRFEFLASLVIFLITIFAAVGLVLQIVDFGFSDQSPSIETRQIVLISSVTLAGFAAVIAVVKGYRWLRK